MDRFLEEHLKGTLFPHSWLPEQSLKKLLSMFAPIRIFQPWFMERPVPFARAGDPPLIEVFSPPVDLKPPGDFERLLAEFRRWARSNPDRGLTVSMAAAMEGLISPEATWEIRGMLRHPGKVQGNPHELKTLRWHLFLHLAQEIEDERREADLILKDLKTKGSPLKGLVEEGETLSHGLEDLPQFQQEVMMDETNLRQVLESWLSLFGSFLAKGDLLITMKPEVMDFISKILDETRVDPGKIPLGPVDFELPDISEFSLEEILMKKGALCKSNRAAREILEFISNPLSATKEKRSRADPPISKQEFEKKIRITLRYVEPSCQEEQIREGKILRPITEKFIVLLDGA